MERAAINNNKLHDNSNDTNDDGDRTQLQQQQQQTTTSGSHSVKDTEFAWMNKNLFLKPARAVPNLARGSPNDDAATID